MSSLPEFTKLAQPNDVPVNPVLRKFHMWWLDQTAVSGMLSYRSVNDLALEIPELVPHLYMVDIEAPENEIRLRFIGNVLEAYIGNRTGTNVKDASSHIDFHRISMEVFQAVKVHKAAIHAGPRRAVVKGRKHMTMESFNVPFSNDGTRVVRIIGAVVFDSSESG